MRTSSRLKILFLLLGTVSFLFLWSCRDTFESFETTDLMSEGDTKSALVEPVGTLSSGALYEIMLPMPVWNTLPQRIMLVYAHGYVDANKPLALPNDAVGGIPIKDNVLSKGMGYASTSYRANGFVAAEGVEDIMLLRAKITDYFADNPLLLPPDALLLVGPSEGGLVTILTIEKYPGYFDAAIATCCPIGDFYKQLQYYGDAHVLFKYFFGPSINEINLGSPKRISKETMMQWDNGNLPNAIVDLLINDYMYSGGNRVRQFVQCANIPVDFSIPEKAIPVILEVMRYPIKATNDILDRLGGNPFNNKSPMRMYSGSDNDRKLNLTVERIKRSDWEMAAENVASLYETTGALMTPLVTIHNLRDHICFYEHQEYYRNKIMLNSPTPLLLVAQLAVDGDCGHCLFELQDIEQALALLAGAL